MPLHRETTQTLMSDAWPELGIVLTVEENQLQAECRLHNVEQPLTAAQLRELAELFTEAADKLKQGDADGRA